VILQHVRLPVPISTVFLFHGLVLGAWATQVPVLRDRLGLSPGALGGALFCISAGAVVAMPAAGRLAARFGPARVIRAGSGTACACFVLAVLASGRAALCAALLAFGMGFGTVDVAMNAEAVRVERRAGRHVLGAVHAMWSVGAFAGSAGGAALLTVLRPAAQAAALAGLSAAAIFVASGRLGAATPPTRHMTGPRPWRDFTLRRIGAGLCMAFAVEGAIADWGGIYLRAVRHVPTARAALGYSAFSLCMVAMRFGGDGLRARYGNAAALRGAIMAAGGMAWVLAAPSPSLALAGFGLAGLGLANVVPALFALAGTRGRDTDASVALAATLGYAGVLAGPPLFGAVAQATSLSAAIGLVGALCCAIGLLEHTLRHGG
jgi:predicted MFS family arabinose efflux permease